MAEPCLFCDPSRSRILCESQGWYVRYDNFPATPGHVEVVPREHIESYFDLSDAEMVEGWRLLHRARAILAAQYVAHGWTIGINDGKAAGRSVDHLHIHLIPRKWGDVKDPRGGIRRGLPNGDPDAWTTALTPGGGR